MNARDAEAKAASTADAITDAAVAAIAAGAVGFHLVWTLPDGDFEDSFDTDDVIAMTEAVNASAFRARLQFARGITA